MSKSTLPRLKALRDEMGKAGITAFIIPGTDPHQSEYYASHWAARTWISGFDGSAGTAVVTTNQAGLWTDSRYFLQAAQQLEDSGFELFKEGLPDTPTIEQWLLTTLPQGATIAIDGTLFGASKAAGKNAHRSPKTKPLFTMKSTAENLSRIKWPELWSKYAKQEPLLCYWQHWTKLLGHLTYGEPT